MLSRKDCSAFRWQSIIHSIRVNGDKCGRKCYKQINRRIVLRRIVLSGASIWIFVLMPLQAIISSHTSLAKNTILLFDLSVSE